MPLKCPKCQRINADKAPICIYCKTSLENAETYVPPDDVSKMAQHFLGKGKQATKPTSTPTPTQAPARPKPSLKIIHGGKSLPDKMLAGIEQTPKAERFWVVLSLGNPSKEAIDTLAKRLKIDPFVAKQRIASGNPWVLRKFEKADQSQELARELMRVGLDVYSLTDTEINEIPPRFQALRVFLEEDGFIFEREKEKVKLAWNSVGLIVLGRLQMRLTDDALDKKPSAKLKKRGLKTMASDSWEYEIMDIFPKSGRGIRVSERDTSFTGLGKHKSPSALRNMRWVIKQIEAHSSPAIDDGYKRMVKVFKPIGAKGDHVARRLGRTNEQQLDMRYMDNSEHFDEYSSLILLHLRKMEG